MKYIIMCGGKYRQWETPRQLIEYKGEPIVARTIRLLREAGVEDIAISSNTPELFDGFGVPVLVHENGYDARGYNDFDGYWVDAFYPMDDPACYLFGDVIFSPDAIRTIVEYRAKPIMLFGSKPPFANNYPKTWREPFAFKVKDQERLTWAIEEVKRLYTEGRFRRKPIAWELWSVINYTDPNRINKHYVGINDYTCDIDYESEIEEVIG